MHDIKPWIIFQRDTTMTGEEIMYSSSDSDLSMDCSTMEADDERGLSSEDGDVDHDNVLRDDVLRDEVLLVSDRHLMNIRIHYTFRFKVLRFSLQAEVAQAAKN